MSDEFTVSRLGRQIACRRRGGSADRTLLYFHGTPESRYSIDCIGEGVLADLGVQIVSFDRPGYGSSDAVEFSFESIAADAAAVLDALDCPSAYLVGQSGGGPFALATAFYEPERVRRIAVSSTPGDYAKVPGAWLTLSTEDRRAAEVARKDKSLAASLFSPGFEELRQIILGGESGLRHHLRESLPHDADLLGDSDFRSAFSISLRAGVAEGVAGCCWDNVAWVSDWSFNLHEVTSRVLIFHSEFDQLIPVDHAKWLAKSIRRSSLSIWKGSGHLGLFGAFGDVATQLLASD